MEILNLIFQLLGFGVFVYGIIIFIIIAIKNCNYNDAKKILVGFLKSSHDYELSADRNYYFSLCHTIKEIIGDSRYEELVKLDSFIPLIQFFDTHAGVPSVEITLNFSDENEKLQIETILVSLTKQYLVNYGEPSGQEVAISWKKNLQVGFPTLVIFYARNALELKSIKKMKQEEVKNIITSNTDIVDEELSVLDTDDEGIDLF